MSNTKIKHFITIYNKKITKVFKKDFIWMFNLTSNKKSSIILINIDIDELRCRMERNE